MNAVTFPKPLNATPDTVTFSRAEWDAYVARMEDAADIAAADDYAGWVRAVGRDEAKRLSYTPEEAIVILDGESIISVWRRRAGLSQRALATAAGISPSYLAEIEAGKKPGSAEAFRKLAASLNLPMEVLIG